jgi:murein DD-endopeptidase MepM/ murein hydrolase activator NlpD
MAKKICAGVFVFSLLALPLVPYQWPVDGPAVVATFAQNSYGGFYRGISVAGKGAEVRPIETGELVFYSEAGSQAGVPPVLGGFAVLQHEQDLRSLYGHLELSREITGDTKTFFGTQDSLGTVGDSGFTELPQLFVAIQDLHLDQIVNPYLVLPPIEERTRPTIRNVMLKSGNTEISFPAAGSVPAGQWEVFADIFDEASVRYFRPTAAYRTAVYINGQETFQLAFDAVRDKDGIPRVYPSQDLAWEHLYAGDWRMRLGTVQLKRGMANLEISVRDFSGNERSQSFQFRVN